jgi:hypothetical protein
MGPKVFETTLHWSSWIRSPGTHPRIDHMDLDPLIVSRLQFAFDHSRLSDFRLLAAR